MKKPVSRNNIAQFREKTTALSKRIGEILQKRGLENIRPVKEKVVGLDVGSSSIRVVSVCREGTGYRIEKLIHKDILLQENETKDEARDRTLTSLIQETELNGKDVVTAIPSHLLSFRILDLPFQDPIRIAAVLSFEIEQYIPFKPEEILLTHYLLETHGEGAKILVLYSEKGSFARFLTMLESNGINPEVVSAAPLGLAQVLSEQAGKESGIISLVDVGHTTTTVVIFDNGIFSGIYSLHNGGEEITETVAEKRNVTNEEAEIWKRANHIETIGMTQNAIMKLGNDIKNVYLGYRKETGNDVEFSFLSGGSAKLTGLEEALSKIVGRKFELWVPNAERIQLPDEEVYKDEFQTFSICLGLALSVISRKGIAANFRAGEFAYQSKEITRTSLLKRAAVYMGVLFFLFIGSVYLKNHFLHKEYTLAKERTSSLFKTIMPDTTRVVNEVQQLRSAHKDMQKKYKDVFELAENRGVFLEVMKDVTERIAKLDIQTKEVMYDLKTLQLEGKAKDFKTLDLLKEEIGKNDNYADIRLLDSQLDTESGKVNFKFTFQVK